MNLINGGWIDEKIIPDSMKYYKDHNHKEDEFNNTNILRRSMSYLIYLNCGWILGEIVHIEINLQQMKNKIY